MDKKALSESDICDMAISVPPLDEQRRIVARINQFRRLSADLRQRPADEPSTQARLAEALVASATAVSEPCPSTAR